MPAKSEQVEVEVEARNVVYHDGKSFGPGERFHVSIDEAEQLVKARIATALSHRRRQGTTRGSSSAGTKRGGSA